MPANITPIFPRIAHNEWGTILTANVAKDGTGTVVTVFTADATNGSRVDYIKFWALGTNVATVARVFLNNGLTNATAANNSMIGQITLPATTNIETAALTEQILWLGSGSGISLDPAHKLNITLGTTVAAGYAAIGLGGHY